MQHNRRQTLLVRLEDVVDDLEVFHVRRAFIVHNDVEVRCPIRIFIDRIQVAGRLARVVSDRYLGIQPLFDPLL